MFKALPTVAAFREALHMSRSKLLCVLLLEFFAGRIRWPGMCKVVCYPFSSHMKHLYHAIKIWIQKSGWSNKVAPIPVSLVLGPDSYANIVTATVSWGGPDITLSFTPPSVHLAGQLTVQEWHTVAVAIDHRPNGQWLNHHVEHSFHLE